jgi:hypothetical protein
MKTRQWVFVTGAPRSGTTFVGKVLSTPLAVDYLHEPFNPYCGISGIDRLYLYLRSAGSTSPRYQRLVESVFTYDFTLKTGYFKEDKYWQTVVKSVIGSRSSWALRFARVNPFHSTMVIKDPIGCLLTEYLAENFAVKPVILIRHPVSVVASAVRLGWNMNLDPIRQQPELVEDYFSDEKEFLFAERKDRVENASALWRALNKVLLSQIKQHPSWRVVTHEALSQDPVAHFCRLYEALDLPWSPRVAERVVALTSRENRVDARKGRVHEFKRNSSGIFAHSLKRLSGEERRRIYEITRDVALQIYPKESFQLDEDEERGQQAIE